MFPGHLYEEGPTVLISYLSTKHFNTLLSFHFSFSWRLAGEQSQVPSGMPIHPSMGQPMGALQHETMMQQRLAAYQSRMAQQERAMATASNMSTQAMQQMQPQQPVAQQERSVAPANMMQQQQGMPQMQPQQHPQGMNAGHQ